MINRDLCNDEQHRYVCIDMDLYMYAYFVYCMLYDSLVWCLSLKRSMHLYWIFRHERRILFAKSEEERDVWLSLLQHAAQVCWSYFFNNIQISYFFIDSILLCIPFDYLLVCFNHDIRVSCMLFRRLFLSKKTTSSEGNWGGGGTYKCVCSLHVKSNVKPLLR